MRAQAIGDRMIELAPAENDDEDFLSLAHRITNGALAALAVREVYLVKTDNWFDFKWLGFRSRGERGELTNLRVPLFNPNRIRSEKHCLWDESHSRWVYVDPKKPLHVRQPGRSWLSEPLDRWSASAAFIWYSGNTTNNKVGSLMLYLSGPGAYAWYASFRKDERWTAHDQRRTSPGELASFEERGRQLELSP